VELNVNTAPLPVINADGDRLVQVLSNLIGNAIKFTPAGGQVWVETKAVPDGVTISVRDTGTGIPESEIPRIFERFYQVDKARGPARGMGLGLAIVNEIVRAHGGRVDVVSREDQGTTFTVWLPPGMAGAVSLR
jgi:signal transduction histidine kinase